MNRLRGWLFYAVLVAVAVAFALAAGTKSRRDSPVPSVTNAGGAGAKALFLYLQENGYDVRAPRDRLLPLPAGTRTVVIASPTARAISADEVKSLTAFVNDGGTLVVLARALGERQPHLDELIRERPGPRPNRARAIDPTSDDPAGVTVHTLIHTGLLAKAASFRVANDSSIGVDHAGALPVVGKGDAISAWWFPSPSGKGEVWVFAGADILENRRIELADNLAFWTALAKQGPLVFDEFHHTSADPPPMSRGLLVLLGQLLACFALFVTARGTRLGPARPELIQQHRSALEYLHSFAWLTRRARVEKELLGEIYARFRVMLHDRLGIAASLPDEEVARELERCCQLPAPEYLRAIRVIRTLEASPHVSPSEFASAARELARIERWITGRAPRSA